LFWSIQYTYNIVEKLGLTQSWISYRLVANHQTWFCALFTIC